MTTPKILALDFDGVLLDGLIEYFQTSQKAYQQIWSSDNPTEMEEYATDFYHLRPVIEIGWEMPVLLRAIVQKIPPEEIFQNWQPICSKIVAAEGLNPQFIMKEVDSIRDKWISSNKKGWLSLHRFYPGVITRVNQILQSKTQLYIVTTKGGRFVQELLEKEGVKLQPNSIIGKECKRPKYESLRIILDNAQEDSANLWFVEDRSKALLLVQQQPDLQNVGLYLADWGYNTEKERESTVSHPGIQLLSLEQFNRDFAAWKQS